MRLHRSASFLRAYRWLPHGLINGVARRIARAERPEWAVDAAVRAWVRDSRIDLGEYVPPLDRGHRRGARWRSLEAFFLRRLRPGARTFAEGVGSPVDGRVTASGVVTAHADLVVKGAAISLERVINGSRVLRARTCREPIALAPFEGGAYVSLFLSPRGYHFVHMPCDGELLDVRWIPGRFFPQNDDALRSIPRVYERNERAVLRGRAKAGFEFLLVMIGASVIGGIELRGVERRDWARSSPFPLRRTLEAGEELGHFTFGSTVILVTPEGVGVAPGEGRDVRLGEALLST